MLGSIGNWTPFESWRSTHERKTHQRDIALMMKGLERFTTARDAIDRISECHDITGRGHIRRKSHGCFSSRFFLGSCISVRIASSNRARRNQTQKRSYPIQDRFSHVLPRFLPWTGRTHCRTRANTSLSWISPEKLGRVQSLAQILARCCSMKSASWANFCATWFIGLDVGSVHPNKWR